MYSVSSFDVLIPRPLKAKRLAGVFKLNRRIGIRGGADTVLRLNDIFSYYGLEAVPGNDLLAEISSGDCSLLPEGFRLEISPEQIRLQGKDAAGLFYAVGALEQMLAAGMARGREEAVLECGVIEDAPRFGYRGFMLDSSRHYQSVECLKRVLDCLARYRINRFHWHMVDGQAWRLESKVAPKLVTLGSAAGDYYSAADVKEIVEYARRHFITIIPEIEMPGHSSGILSGFPQFCCTPEKPGAEFCLGNPEGKAFLKALIDEFLDYFPDSPVIHLGGDEANTAHWENCPKCRKLAEELGGLTMRQLENRFMNDMARHVLSRGRIPMGWGTESILPEKMIVQVWRSDHELVRNFREGNNNLVASVHYNCYFDYPINSNEPDFNWMLGLPEETVYRAEPAFNAAELLGEKLLGTEAALWTEIVPEWRVMQKILPRLPAYAETAWSSPEDKQYQDFVRRMQMLEAAGYVDYLKNSCTL